MKTRAYAVVFALAMTLGTANLEASVARRVGSDVKAASLGLFSDVHGLVKGVYHGTGHVLGQMFGHRHKK